MCSITMALAGISTGLQMYGQAQQTKAAVESANAQAQAATDQAAAARAQAEQQRQAAEASYQNARIQSRKGEQVAEAYNQKQQELSARRRLAIAQNNAQQGAAGLIGNIGSGLDILNATNEAYEKDSLNLLANQRNSTYDNYMQEVNFRNQGNAQTAQAFNTELNAQQYDKLSASYVDQAKQAQKMGQIGMFSTLLSGAASMIGMAKSGGDAAKADAAQSVNQYYGGSDAGRAGYLTNNAAAAAWSNATETFRNGDFGLDTFTFGARKAKWSGTGRGTF